MHNLKFSQLLLVGKPNEQRFFENYFREVMLLERNSDVLKWYTKSTFFTIFLDCDSLEGNVFEIAEEIRKHDHKRVIVFLSSKIDRDKLLKAIPLHLSGCIHRPLDQNQVEDVLEHVQSDLERISEDCIRLKSGYRFHVAKQILYDAFHQEVKLTKNELTLLKILLRDRDKCVEAEVIEHEIWEEDSLEIDCTNRLKNLLYNLRKKLPEGSISNNYKLGYKLLCEES